MTFLVTATGARLTKIKNDGSNETSVNSVVSKNPYIENQYLYFTKSNGMIEQIEISNAVNVDLASYDVLEERKTNN